MRSDLIRTVLPERTDEWFEYRRNTLGSSDIAVVMGLSQYKLAMTLFLEKIGYQDEWRDGNASTYFGIMQENIIAETWQRWTPGVDESYVKNFQDDVIVRKCRNVKGSFVNPDYPWLSASPDRIIQKGEQDINGTPLEKEGVLEIKTANQFVLKKWKTAVPPQYVMQVQEQLLVLGLDYAEIAIFDNMRVFDVYPMESNSVIQEEIVNVTREFWEGVQKGRKLMKEVERNPDKEAIIFQQIEDLLPSPAQGQEFLYKQFLDEKYSDSVDDKLMGGDEQMTLCEEISKLQSASKQIESMIENRKNSLKEYMQENQVLFFEEEGKKVTWKPTAKGNRMFRVTYPEHDCEELKIVL